MKFNIKHPYAKHNDGFSYDGDNVVYFSNDGKCLVCGEITHFASISFETWFCSEDCLDKEWAEFWHALSGGEE